MSEWSIPYGIDRETGKKVHILQADKKHKYICVECRQPLMICNGEKMPKFFRHFRTQKECPLLTYGGFSFEGGSGDPADGIEQHFPEWMAYIRAVAEGRTEEAERILAEMAPSVEPQTEQTMEKPMKEDPPIPPSMEIDFSETISRVLQFEETQQEPIQPAIDIPAPDQMEWMTRQAILKPIKKGEVEHCPLSGINASVEEHCESCEYFSEIRYPLRNMEKPPVVICRGHHQRFTTTLFG